MTTPYSDTELLAILRNPRTHDQGFRALLNLYGEKLYWHIRRLVVGHDDAEDVMQETSINIFRHIDKFKGNSSLLTWCYRIATNEALRWLQKQAGLWKSSDAVSEQLADNIATENNLDPKAAEVLFQQAILKLPTQQRITFNMRYYDDLSYEEISQITGKSVGTLKTNYHIAQEKVRNYLKENML